MKEFDYRENDLDYSEEDYFNDLNNDKHKDCDKKTMTKREIAIRVCSELIAMLSNNIVYENGGESFEGWCADGEVFEDTYDPDACMDFVRQIAPDIDKATWEMSKYVDGHES